VAITTSRLRPLLVSGVILLLVTCVLLPVQVAAHADLEQSNPPVGALLATSPPMVELWFTEELFRREGENTVEVYGPDGSRVDLGDAAIDDDDRTHMTVSLPPDLPPGSYTVRWRSLSASDGHSEEGEFTFTVDPNAPTAPTHEHSAVTPPATGEPVMDTAPTATVLPEPAPTPPNEPSPTVPGNLMVPVGAGVIALGVLVAVIAFRRNR
jgi:copper transport protein